MRSNPFIAALSAILVFTHISSPSFAHGADQHSGKKETTVPQTAEGEGIVKAIDAKAGKVTLRHQPIAALNWPAMTMTFRVESGAVLNNVSVGKKVHFILKNDNGKPVVTEINPL